MNGSTRILHVRHTEALYTDLLASDMYAPPEALWELVKNGLDAIYRLQSAMPSHDAKSVRIELVKDHPLCPKDTALLVTDTGTGLTEVSLERYSAVGSEGDASDGLTDQKRIGRIAAFALMSKKLQRDGYWVLSSTSVHGPVMMMRVSPAELAEQKLTIREIPRDDIHLAGRCPQGSFTTILIPHVVTSMRDEAKIMKALEWQIPRYKSPDSIKIIVGERELEPPPMPKELVIHWSAATNTSRVYTGKEAVAIASPLDLSPGTNDLIGFFGKVEETVLRGIRLCDDLTRTRVALSLNMIAAVPFPFGKTELGGDLFIPGDVIRKQNTARSGFSPDYLTSDEWRGQVKVLIDHFTKPLARLLGDESILRDDPLGVAMRSVVQVFKEVYGAPSKDVHIPEGVQPPPGFEDEEEGDQEPARGDGPVKTPKPHSRPKKRKARPIPFCYKGVTYVLGTGREEVNVAAAFYGPNLVSLSTRDPMTTQYLKKSKVALRLYVLSVIIRCIEETLPGNVMAPLNCDVAVQEALLKFFSHMSD